MSGTREQQEAEAKRRAAEEEREQQEAEAKRRAAEEERERREQQEAEAKRRAAEEEREQQEAEAKRRAAEGGLQVWWADWERQEAERQGPAHPSSRKPWAGLKRALAFNREKRTPSVDQFVSDLRGGQWLPLRRNSDRNRNCCHFYRGCRCRVHLVAPTPAGTRDIDIRAIAARGSPARGACGARARALSAAPSGSGAATPAGGDDQAGPTSRRHRTAGENNDRRRHL